MSPTDNKVTGLFVLGNSGVGKTLLVNIMLGENKYVHEESVTSVTSNTESTTGHGYQIFNIPGLIEADQQLIERNKREIERAFQQCPNSRILFVCAGGVGGRLQDQDVVAYKALAQAYKFNPRSVVFIMNRLTKKSSKSAEFRTKAIDLLRKMLELPHSVTDKQFVFVANIAEDEVNNFESEDHQTIYASIAVAIEATEPAVHVKTQEVRLLSDEITRLKDVAAQQQNQFIQWQKENKAEMERMTQRYENQMAELNRALEQAKKRRRRCIIC